MVDDYFLSFDLSTQTLKALVINDTLHVIKEQVINFDRDLPEFKTTGGVHQNDLVATSPVQMWIKAMDLLLMKLFQDKFEFSKVKAVSGTGQQHGSVYWKKGASNILKSLNDNLEMGEQLEGQFTVLDCPIWMDSSTSAECRHLELVAGGPEELSNISGSRAYERFTGNQIAKIYKRSKRAYENCDRISLVSSFIASLFIGDYAPIDLSDGSGMNLLDIRTKKWNEKFAQACAPDLISRLGDPVPANSKIGSISKYMIKRFGFSNDCFVTAFTGDNPSSLAGMRLHKGDVAVSLGTSDTLIFWLEKAKPAMIGHVFVNPVNEDSYMALLCYKNGSFAREKIRDLVAGGKWDEFNQALQRTSPGNNGNIGVYFFDQEIIPNARGIYRWNAKDEKVESFPPDIEIRALVEGQFIAKKNHAEKLGFHLDQNSRILATGGASQNIEILQILSNIFFCPVYAITDTANSACLGGNYRAKHTLSGQASFEECVRNAAPYKLIASPNKDAYKIYESLCKRYVLLENQLE